MRIHLNKLRKGLIAAVLFGVLCGAATRSLMRLFALVGRQLLNFEWATTLGVVALMVLLYLPGACALAVLRGRWRLVGHALVAAAFIPHVMEAVIFYEDLLTFFWSTGRWAVYWTLHAVYAAVLLACWYGIARLTRQTGERAPDAVGGDPCPRVASDSRSRR